MKASIKMVSIMAKVRSYLLYDLLILTLFDILKVSGSGIMESDMKASIKKANFMARVRMKLFPLWFIDSKIIWYFLGKLWSGDSGDRYEGEFKDDKFHCKGKIEVIYFYDLLILKLFDYPLGKWYRGSGDRYEGEFKDGIFHGQGKKEMIYLMIYWF